MRNNLALGWLGICMLMTGCRLPENAVFADKQTRPVLRVVAAPKRLPANFADDILGAPLCLASADDANPQDEVACEPRQPPPVLYFPANQHMEEESEERFFPFRIVRFGRPTVAPAAPPAPIREVVVVRQKSERIAPPPAPPKNQNSDLLQVNAETKGSENSATTQILLFPEAPEKK